jgi:hypothetical protein
MTASTVQGPERLRGFGRSEKMKIAGCDVRTCMGLRNRKGLSEKTIKTLGWPHIGF